MAVDDDQAADRWSDYCPDHAKLCAQYGTDFGPFPGCANPSCKKPDGFDVDTQPHLAAAAKA